MTLPPPRKASSVPFIVTAELPADIYSWANGLRCEHYPRERNKLAAHVTLFHSFAPSLRDELPRVLSRFAQTYAAPPAQLDGLFPLDSHKSWGTALAITSREMLFIREDIAEHFYTMLTAQDRITPRLHITIQNKVSREVANNLQSELAAQLQPKTFHFTGLGLHLYRESHWESLGCWKFRGKVHAGG